jgi:hypothetical protein
MPRSPHIPPELLGVIVDFIPRSDPQTLLALSATSQALNYAAERVLYASIGSDAINRRERTCSQVCEALRVRTERREFVRSVDIGTFKFNLQDELRVQLIELLATLSNLQQMRIWFIGAADSGFLVNGSFQLHSLMVGGLSPTVVDRFIRFMSDQKQLAHLHIGHSNSYPNTPGIFQLEPQIHPSLFALRSLHCRPSHVISLLPYTRTVTSLRLHLTQISGSFIPAEDLPPLSEPLSRVENFAMCYEWPVTVQPEQFDVLGMLTSLRSFVIIKGGQVNRPEMKDTIMLIENVGRYRPWHAASVPSSHDRARQPVRACVDWNEETRSLNNRRALSVLEEWFESIPRMKL